jgi:hypothetical protein
MLRCQEINADKSAKGTAGERKVRITKIDGFDVVFTIKNAPVNTDWGG